MKTFLFLLLTTLTLSAQNFGVTFYATNSAEVLAGMPRFYPKSIDVLGTNTSATPPAVLMTGPQLQECFRTNQVAYEAYQGVAIQVKTNANLARIVALFNQIPAARVQMQQIQSTNLTTVAALSVAVKAEANVLDGILEELQRLGPVLKQLYKPEEDATP